MSNYTFNITAFFSDADHFNISGSRVEHGQDAARITWNNAKEASAEFNYLDTEAKQDAMRRHLKEMGFSEADDEHSPAELNALLLQCIAGDIREVPDMEPGAWDWDAYAGMCENGTLAGRMYRGDDGDVYYYIGS